jgi:hypothetical protein
MKKERTPEQIAKNPNPPKAPGTNSAARRRQARVGKPRKEACSSPAARESASSLASRTRPATTIRPAIQEVLT